MKDANRCFRILLPSEGQETRAVLDRLIAETWAAGAAGHEEVERPGEREVELVVHFRAAAEEEIRRAISSLADDFAVGSSEEVPAVDWVARWRDSLSAIVVSDRLVVRPESVEHALAAGQVELVIDPGQAFGTGSHASTSLALESVIEGSADFGSSTRVLDVGTGTGILALAALRLGAGSAVGFDLDPLAAPEARRWAARNGLADRFCAFTGGVESLGTGRFDWVLANLLRRELVPIAPALVSRVSTSGRLVLSGLLASDCAEVEDLLASLGLARRFECRRQDDTGDEWVSWVMAPA